MNSVSVFGKLPTQILMNRRNNGQYLGRIRGILEKRIYIPSRNKKEYRVCMH